MLKVTTSPRFLSSNTIACRLESYRRFLDQSIMQWDVFDLAASMSLLLLLLYGGEFWYLKRPVTLLCMAAILYTPLRKSDLFWFVILLVIAVSNYYNAYFIDNHKYLINYWCLTLYLARLSADPAKTIAISARYLIAFAFLLATGWKLISHDYLDGTFFHYSLLLDDRFTTLTAFLGNLTRASDMQNHEVMNHLLEYASTQVSVQLHSTAQISWIAIFLTWWTVMLEGLIAIAFLWPQSHLVAKWRDLPLLLFILTTYSIAQVIGFGWVLIIMGTAQSTLISKYNRLLYIAAFFILQVYLMPWQTILSSYVHP